MKVPWEIKLKWFQFRNEHVPQNWSEHCKRSSISLAGLSCHAWRYVDIWWQREWLKDGFHSDDPTVLQVAVLVHIYMTETVDLSRYRYIYHPHFHPHLSLPLIRNIETIPSKKWCYSCRCQHLGFSFWKERCSRIARLVKAQLRWWLIQLKTEISWCKFVKTYCLGYVVVARWIRSSWIFKVELLESSD